MEGSKDTQMDRGERPGRWEKGKGEEGDMEQDKRVRLPVRH